MENKSIFWDQENNTIHIQKAITPKLKQRGFIIQTVDSQEELNKMMAGEQTGNSISISPVLADNEDQAIEFLRTKGKIPINILSYEMIHFQSKLLNELAEKSNIELIVEPSNFSVQAQASEQSES